MALKRKKRSDRNHIIYKLTNTITQETYIGVTVSVKKAYKKSVRSRWLRHVYRANIELSPLTISQSIRDHGESSFTREILHIIKGKAAAFCMEANIINELLPQLNTKRKTVNKF
jgi:hypothetical protein